jgi:2'-5' RNA ligase
MPGDPEAVGARQHNEVLKAAYKRGEALEERLVRILRPILEHAGNEAATAFRHRATDHLTASALRRTDRLAAGRAIWGGYPRAALRPSLVAAGGLRGVRPTSTMVCLKPRPEEAEAIADPEGAAPETLHVTLASLGSVEGDLEPVVAAVRQVATEHAPLVGKVGGYGRFDPPGCGILLPDVPGLVELRVAVTEALVAADLGYARDHGFQPHLTVDGDPEPDEAEQMLERAAGAPLHFDAILVVRGDSEVYEVPLVGSPPLTASGTPEQVAKAQERVTTEQDSLRHALESGDQRRIEDAKARVEAAKANLRDLVVGPQWSKPAGDELIDVKALAQTLRTKTDPVRQALIHNIVGSTHKLIDPVGGKYRWEKVASDDVSSDELIGEIDGWAGEAEDVAGAAITDAEMGDGDLYLLRDRATGRLVAVANVEGGSDSLIVRDIASSGGGAGTALLRQIAREASSSKLGVRLRATPDAAGYYRKLKGFEEGDDLDFHLPADKTAEFVGTAKTVAASDRAAAMFDVTNPLIAKALSQSGSKITEIADTTRANVMDIISTAYDEGLSIPDTATLIESAMRDSAEVRARMIARTELVGAINGGSLAATQLVASATGSRYQKRWLTAVGARYPRHELYDGLDGQTVGLDEQFDVGGESLDYPGDPDGDPGETINCRCTMIYVDGPEASAAAVRQSIDAPTMWGEDLAS